MKFALMLALKLAPLMALGAVASVSAALSLSLAQATASGSAVDKIVFENVGFSGYYYDVASYSDITSDNCECKLSTSFTTFEGSNAPLNEELSVHLRGPISLKSFGYYVTDDLSSGTWDRKAYYDAESQNATNVTFMKNGGAFSPCAGYALTYLSANGTGTANESTVLESDNLVESNEEYTILSGSKCGASSALGDCGFYREGIPAYHGFYGTTKMFLFEFEMPEATDSPKTATHNMPAIWFLNAKIPRTSQYNANTSCSCWTSGCGELDIFEVLNATEPLQLDSTIHDYQGTDDIQNGLEATDYFTRDTEGTMRGGVVFTSDGTITVFMDSNLSIEESVAASDVASWISSATSEDVKSLSSVSMDTSTSSSKKSDAAAVGGTGFWFTAVTVALLAFLYL